MLNKVSYKVTSKFILIFLLLGIAAWNLVGAEGSVPKFISTLYSKAIQSETNVAIDARQSVEEGA